MCRSSADIHCGVCHVGATSEAQLQQHMQGKRHTRALERSNSDSVSAGGSEEDLDAPGLEAVAGEGDKVKCSTCDVTLDSRKLASSHVR